MENKFFKFPLILGLVGLICAGALSVVYEITNPIIIERTKGATLAALREVVADLDDADDITADFSVEKTALYGISTVYSIEKANTITDYGYQAVGKGYGGDMTFLLVLSASENKIVGMKVISHNETNSGKYGGPLLNSPDFAAQFENLSFDDVESGVDYVAGSTAKITLGGVKNCVNNVITFHRSEVKKEAIEVSETKLTNSEIAKLNLPEGQKMVDKTEELKTKLGNKATKAISDMGLLNYVDIVNASDAVVGHAYITESAISIPEVGSQVFRMVFAFDATWGNSKLTVVSSTDTLTDAGNNNYRNGEDYEASATGLGDISWLNQFNGQTMAHFIGLLGETTPLHADTVEGATFTTNEARLKLVAVVKYHNQANS